MLYMDRVTGQLAKQAGQISSVRKIKLDIFDNLFHWQICFVFITMIPMLKVKTFSLSINLCGTRME